VDNDGYLDLFIGNEHAPSQLFRNKGDGTFEDISHAAGVDQTATTKGVAAADYDNDGYVDFYLSNSAGENFLYHNNHDLTFTEIGKQAGVQAPYYSFATWFFDYDNDGWPDLFIANGHVDPQVEGQSFGVGYAERPFLFHNLGEQFSSGSSSGERASGGQVSSGAHPNVGKFVEVGVKAGGALAKKYVGRGALTADFWNRGRQDLLVTNLDGAPILLRNEVSRPGHWLEVKTIGSKSNRDGFGARIELTAAGQTRYAEVRAGSSFESSSDPRLHFGLGAAARADSIVIRWPSGIVENLGPVAADQLIVVHEGKGIDR
jgi:enediyne biosynthesis protein E4